MDFCKDVIEAHRAADSADDALDEAPIAAFDAVWFEEEQPAVTPPASTTNRAPLSNRFMRPRWLALISLGSSAADEAAPVVPGDCWVQHSRRSGGRTRGSSASRVRDSSSGATESERIPSSRRSRIERDEIMTTAPHYSGAPPA